MTDQPTNDDQLRDEAKRVIASPPEPVAGAEGLPDDVRDGHIEDDGSTVDHHEGD